MTILEGFLGFSMARNVEIGSNTFVARDVHFAAHEQIRVGNNVVINRGVEILSASHDVNDPEWKMVKSAIVIDDYAWIATGAMILPGVRVGFGAVVGAGAVVRSDVPDYGIVVGNPALLLKKERTKELAYSPVEFNSAYEAWLGRSK